MVFYWVGLLPLKVVSMASRGIPLGGWWADSILGGQRVSLVVIVFASGVSFRVIKVNYQSDPRAEVIIVAGLAFFEDALDRPAEVIRHGEQGFAQGRLDVEDHFGFEVVGPPALAGPSGGTGEGVVEDPGALARPRVAKNLP